MHFCTYFDRNYLHKGLALYRSLKEHAADFTLWVLCFDDVTMRALERLSLPHLRLISQYEFEAANPDLLLAKETRSTVEYYWTSTPSLPLYVFGLVPEIDLVVYIDADIFFYSSPEAIVEELGDGNILIIPHDFADQFADHVVNGIYNVGVMVFRKNQTSLECLRRWREQCIEWCYYHLASVHANGVGDQGYLNDWPERVPGVIISTNPGVNAGPWNIGKYGVRRGHGRIEVGGRRLVCYHFHGVRICTSWLAHIAGPKTALPTSELALVYRPYLDALSNADAQMQSLGIDVRQPKTGIPWRYLVGQIARGQPVRHFLWLATRVV